MDNAVDAKTGTIRLKALRKNADARLWPGQFVRVGLTIATLENAVTIPTQAVLDGVTGPYVYVLGGDGKAEVRKITPGPIVEAETVVEKAGRRRNGGHRRTGAAGPGRCGRNQKPGRSSGQAGRSQAI